MQRRRCVFRITSIWCIISLFYGEEKVKPERISFSFILLKDVHVCCEVLNITFVLYWYACRKQLNQYLPAHMLKSKKKSLPSTDAGSRGNTPKNSSDAASRLTPSPLNKTGDSISEDEFLYGPSLSSPNLAPPGRDSPSASSIEVDLSGTGDVGDAPQDVFQSPNSSRTQPPGEQASTDDVGNGPKTQPSSQVYIVISS